MREKNRRVLRRLSERRLLRHHADVVVHDLQKSSLDREPTVSAAPRKPQLSTTEQRHHRRVTLENAHFAIVSGGHYRFDLPLEQDGLGRDDGDLEHDQLCASVLAFATASSMLPTI